MSDQKLAGCLLKIITILILTLLLLVALLALVLLAVVYRGWSRQLLVLLFFWNTQDSVSIRPDTLAAKMQGNEGFTCFLIGVRHGLGGCLCFFGVGHHFLWDKVDLGHFGHAQPHGSTSTHIHTEVEISPHMNKLVVKREKS